MNKEYFVFLIFGIIILSILSANFLIPSKNFPEGSSSVSENVLLHSMACVYINGELHDCDHNILYDSGKDIVKTYLGDTGGGTDEVDQIYLCNANETYGCGEPAADQSEDFNTFIDCGMDVQTGAYTSIGTGNWSIYYQFTSTCDNVMTNVTRIGNSAGNNLSAVSFALATLQANDQLAINWTLWVEA